MLALLMMVVGVVVGAIWESSIAVVWLMAFLTVGIVKKNHSKWTCIGSLTGLTKRGHLRLDSPSRKNFFAVRSYNRKNIFAIGYSIRKNFFAVGRFKLQELLCANIVAGKELSVIRRRMQWRETRSNLFFSSTYRKNYYSDKFLTLN